MPVIKENIVHHLVQIKVGLEELRGTGERNILKRQK